LGKKLKNLSHFTVPCVQGVFKIFYNPIQVTTTFHINLAGADCFNRPPLPLGSTGLFLCFQLMDNAVFIIHEIVSYEWVEYGVAFHAVILRQIIVVAQPLDNRRFGQHILLALFQRMDITGAFVDIFCHAFFLLFVKILDKGKYLLV